MQSDTARIIAEAPKERDPSQQFPGMPPLYGQYAIPQVFTVQGLATSLAKVYRASDEAMKHSWENARYMRNDCGLMESVEARQRSVALLNWHLEPEDQKSPKQKQLCEDLTRIVKRIPRFMQFREQLLHAVWYGVYGVQCKYGWQNINGQMRVVPVQHQPVNGDKLVFGLQDGTAHAGRVGVRIGRMPPEGLLGERKAEYSDRGMCYFLQPYERRAFCIHQHQIEDGSYEDPLDAGKINGVGIRSKIYWEWFQKQELLAMLMEYAERSALGFEIWHYPAGNAEAKSQTEYAARNRVGNKNIIIVPSPIGDDADQYRVDHIEPGMAGMDSIKALLTEYFGHRIKRYILGQTLTSEADATGLGSGVAQIHLGTFLDIVKYDATNLEETLTTDLIEPLKMFNFPEASGVHVRFVIETESVDSEGKLAAYEKAWNMGARLREADVLEAVNAAMPTGDDVVLQNPQLRQQAMAQAGMVTPADMEQRKQEMGAEIVDHLRQQAG